MTNDKGQYKVAEGKELPRIFKEFYEFRVGASFSLRIAAGKKGKVQNEKLFLLQYYKGN